MTAMSTPKYILIVGGSRGIGFELVQQSLSLYPFATLFVTARDIKQAPKLHELALANTKRVEIVVVDVTDPESVAAAAKQISTRTSYLDLVIFNSGTFRGRGNLLEVGVEALKENIDTNVYGAYYTAVEFSPFLLKSEFPKRSLVLMSSEFGSLELDEELFKSHAALFNTPDHDPTAMYNISKTALNRLGKELDQVLRRKGLPFILIHPGLVVTDMNPFGDIGVTESATGILNVIESFGPGEKNFVSYNGKPIPW
ncbi:hypothetical protein F5884DRAFT_903976 [Xylogone sp. PMI_703]|nr:hypothetical protein F5884DRAFT_903976 [Xylogone sp. PMI_703]